MVVYATESGETYFLSAASALLLECLGDGPVSITTLRQDFQDLSDTDLDPQEILKLIEGAVESVRKIGLIKIVESPS